MKYTRNGTNDAATRACVAEPHQQVNGRRQDESKQYREQHDRQHEFSPIAESENGSDPNGSQGPMELLGFRVWDSVFLCATPELYLFPGHVSIVIEWPIFA